MNALEPHRYRRIRVGDFTAGMISLEEIFADLCTESDDTEAALATELLRRAAQYNYIPASAEPAHVDALLR